MRGGQERLSLALMRARTCLHTVCMFRGCTRAVNLDPTHFCNFKCMTTQVSRCCHLDSRSAATDAGVHLPRTQGLAVQSLFFIDSMPGAPTRSTADNLTAARQKVGPPSILGAGRFFQQKSVREEFWTELLVKDSQWYELHFRKVSRMITMLLRHTNEEQLRNLRKNRIQGDIVLIDFLQTDVMKRNFPTLCPLFPCGPGSLHGEEALHLQHCQGYQQLEGRCQLFVDLQPVSGGKAG